MLWSPDGVWCARGVCFASMNPSVFCHVFKSLGVFIAVLLGILIRKEGIKVALKEFGSGKVTVVGGGQKCTESRSSALIKMI